MWLFSKLFHFQWSYQNYFWYIKHQNWEFLCPSQLSRRFLLGKCPKKGDLQLKVNDPITLRHPNFDNWFRLTLDPLVTLRLFPSFFFLGEKKVTTFSTSRICFCVKVVVCTLSEGDRLLSKIHQSSVTLSLFLSCFYRPQWGQNWNEVTIEIAALDSW